MSSAPILELVAVNTYYGDSHILQDVSFSMAAGGVVALLGRNGVGKTTTIQTILGLPAPSRGDIRFRGASIVNLPTHAIIRQGIGWVPQGHRIFPTLSLSENLDLAALNARPGHWVLSRIYELFPWMEERRKAPGGFLSGGEQQMLAIARALIQNPELILFDEPSEGLSPKIIDDIGAIIAHLSGEGCTVLVVEQNLAFALRIARRALIMNKGRIVFDGSSAELEAETDAVGQYLGVSDAQRPSHSAGEPR